MHNYKNVLYNYKNVINVVGRHNINNKKYGQESENNIRIKKIMLEYKKKKKKIKKRIIKIFKTSENQIF